MSPQSAQDQDPTGAIPALLRAEPLTLALVAIVLALSVMLVVAWKRRGNGNAGSGPGPDGHGGRWSGNGHTAARALYTADWFKDVTEGLSDARGLKESVDALREELSSGLAEIRNSLEVHTANDDAALAAIHGRLGTIDGSLSARITVVEREVQGPARADRHWLAACIQRVAMETGIKDLSPRPGSIAERERG